MLKLIHAKRSIFRTAISINRVCAIKSNIKVIKIGPQFLEPKGNVLCVAQPTIRSTFDVPPDSWVCVANCSLPFLFILFWVFGYAYPQLRSLHTCTISIFEFRSVVAWERGWWCRWCHHFLVTWIAMYKFELSTAEAEWQQESLNTAKLQKYKFCRKLCIQR